MPLTQKEINKRYMERNPERFKEIKRKYHQTESYRKSATISGWKQKGLIETSQYSYEDLYEAYLYCGYCELCDVKLTTGNRDATFKCMDHDHETGIFRDILCNSCNIKRR